MKTSSQTALKVLSIIGIVVGAIIAVSGVVLTVGANGFAMYQASSSGAGVAVLGTIGGVVIGALLLGVINMGMSIMGIGDSWQYVVKGGVLLLAVIFDVVTSRKSGKG